MKGERGGQDGETKGVKGGWILPSALNSTFSTILPSFLSLSSLVSVLSNGSQCESVAIIYTHEYMILHTLLYLLSFCDMLCGCITDWLGTSTV